MPGQKHATYNSKTYSKVEPHNFSVFSLYKRCQITYATLLLAVTISFSAYYLKESLDQSSSVAAKVDHSDDRQGGGAEVLNISRLYRDMTPSVERKTLSVRKQEAARIMSVLLGGNCDQQQN